MSEQITAPTVDLTVENDLAARFPDIVTPIPAKGMKVTWSGLRI